MRFHPAHLVGAFLAGALAVALAATGPVTEVASAGTAPAPVSTNGRWLVDDQGRTIYVRGLQIAHKTTPYLPPSASITDADAQLMKGLGINSVRLAWFWKGLEPRRGQYDAAYAAEIAREVDVLTRNGLWVLVEFHQDDYNESVHGAGFPDWATFTDGRANPPDTLPGGAYMTNPALQQAFANLWNNRDGIQDAMARAWQVIASAVRPVSHGHLLGYDLFNEPWPGAAFPLCVPPLGCAGLDSTRLQPLQDKLALAVRTIDPTTPVFYEPFLLADFGAPSYLRKPAAGVGNAVFSFHDYCMITGFTKKANEESKALGYPLCPLLDGLVYRNAIATANRMGAAVVQTEFGDTQDMNEVGRIMKLADTNLTGWMLWAYKDWIDYPGGIGDGGLFADSDDNSTIHEAMADTIARPGPQLISGTPTKYTYDPATGRMELNWTARAGVTAPTVIYVPVSRHYPRGYDVTVTGGSVTSAPDATYLQVHNTGSSIHLVLTRR